MMAHITNGLHYYKRTFLLIRLGRTNQNGLMTDASVRLSEQGAADSLIPAGVLGEAAPLRFYLRSGVKDWEAFQNTEPDGMP